MRWLKLLMCQLTQHVVVKDERLLLVTFALETIHLDEHFNAFKVVHATDGPHAVDVRALFCHKACIQMSYSSDDSSLFNVPYCFLRFKN